MALAKRIIPCLDVDKGRVVKGVGLVAVLAGGFIGGYAVRALGVLPALWIAGILQTLSNLMFYWLAEAGERLTLLVSAVSVENLAGGFGTVIFVAYISGLCRERAYTATQFALLTSLAALGRTGLAAGSGYLAGQLGWSLFFLISVIAALPGLMLLYWIARYRTDNAGRLADAATN